MPFLRGLPLQMGCGAYLGVKISGVAVGAAAVRWRLITEKKVMLRALINPFTPMNSSNESYSNPG